MKVPGKKSEFENKQIPDDFYQCEIGKVELRTNENSKSSEKRYWLVHVKAPDGSPEGATLVFPMGLYPTDDAKSTHGKLVAAMYGKFEVGKDYDTDDYIGKRVNIFWMWNEKDKRMVASVFKKA